jgi:hypothetical protein
MEKKYILAGIPVVALLLTMILPLVSLFGFGAALFKFFESDGNAVLALVFIIVSLGVAYCAYVDKYMQYAPYALLLPFLWLLIWNPGFSIGIGAWLYLILAICEIVLVLKPDLLDNMLAKKQ